MSTTRPFALYWSSPISSIARHAKAASIALCLAVAACAGPQRPMFAPAIDEAPMYGSEQGTVKTPLEIEADRTFIASFLSQGYTRETGAEAAAALRWRYFRTGDRATAMKRFNQAWLLDPRNAESFHGFAVLSVDASAPDAPVYSYFQRSLKGRGVKHTSFVDFG